MFQDHFFDDRLYCISGQMVTKSAEKWVAWAIRNKRSIFFYQDKVLDLTDFVSYHPGGKKVLQNYAYKDITHTLFKIYPHDRASTLHRLSQFLIGRIEKQQNTRRQEQKVSLRKSNKSKSTQKKKVRFKKKVTNKSIENGGTKKNSINKRQVRVAKGKSLTKKYCQLSSSRGKENQKDRFCVSIRLIEGEQEDRVFQRKKSKKRTQQAKQKEFYSRINCEQIQQNKNQIACRVFEVKGKVNL